MNAARECRCELNAPPSLPPPTIQHCRAVQAPHTVVKDLKAGMVSMADADMDDGLDPAIVDAFIARWEASGGAERSNTQSFLNELCDLIGQPHPDLKCWNHRPHESFLQMRRTPLPRS